jgi:hypothetical protein
MHGLNAECATFVLHPGHNDIVGLHDGFDSGRATSAWKMVLTFKALLRQRPLEMRFDPPLSLLFQMGDGGYVDRPSLGFGKRGALPAMRLVPDPYFHGSNGFEKLRRLVIGGELAPWRKRERMLFWRGTATGQLGEGGYQELPRVRLASICRGQRRTDVKICNVPDQVRPRHDPAAVAAELRRAELMGDRVPMSEFARRRYTVDIDGNANAWGLFEKMLLGLCILKVETPWSQWFYDRIVPWEHYVPIRADLSDLPALIEWCLAHDTEASAIAEQAQRLALAMTFEAEMALGAAAAAAVLTPLDAALGVAPAEHH